MSRSIADKLKIMRESERITSLPEAAKMLGLNRDALWRYETGKTVPNVEVVMNILKHPKFEKYTLWFMVDKIAPESGQIVPALAHYGQEKTNSQLSDQKIG